MEAKFGGFSGTTGTVNLKVGDTSIGTGNLNGTNDVTISSNSTATGNTLTVTVTDIDKGVKCYYISYTYSNGGTTVETVATPTFSPAQGTYYEAQNVTISCATDGATIHYTTDGSDPDENSPEYNNSPISVGETTTIKAIAVKDGMNNSGIASATYTIDEPTEVELNYENTLINGHEDFYIIDRSLGGLSQVWKNSSYGITANGQNRTEAVESWLYSPVFDATSKSGYTISLNFEENLRYFASSDMPTSQATLWVREGTTGEWQQLTITPHANVDNNTFHSIEKIDLSAYAGKKFQLAFKYIADTENAPGRWELKNFSVTATKEATTDLYILGMVNGNGSQPDQGVKMNYDGNNYTAKIWVIGNSSNNMGVPGTWFAFTTVLAKNNNDGGWDYVNQNRYSPTPSDGLYYWLNSGANEGALVSDEPLTKQNNDNAFLIPAGLYEITVSGDLSKFSLTSIKNLKPTITPEGGEVLLNSTATIALAEDFNDFIGDCNPVVTYAGSPVSITAPVAKLFVNDNAVVGTSSTYTFSTAGSTTLTGKGALVVNGNDQYAAKTNSQNFTVVEPSEGSVYTLVTSATDLEDGAHYIIASGKNEGSTYVMGSQNNNNRASVSNTVALVSNVPTITIGVNEAVFTLGGSTSEGWSFFDSAYGTDGGYLYAANTSNGSNNYLRSQATNNENGIATISIGESGNAVITFGGEHNGRNTIRFNSASNQLIFSCYASTGQQPVYLYKKATATTPKSEAPVITPDSKDVKGGLLEDVTITAAQGATIYYTTDGSDPSDDTNTNRVQYTKPFNIQVAQGGPQTVKAIAIETGKDPSNVVSVQYTFKNPDAPTFTPDPDVVQTGDFAITINSADGGVIYYVLDPDPNEFPSNSQEVIDANNVYADGVAVSGTGEHKIYAAVVLNGLKSTLSTATYTVIETGAEGDWTLVTSTDDIQAGRDYIIVNSDRDKTVGEFNPTLTSGNFSSIDCENNVVFGPDFNTATVAGSNVTIFTVEEENGNLYMKSGDTYYVPSTTESYINTGKNPVYFSMNGGFVAIKGSADADRSFAYNYQSSMRYFASYKNPTTTGNQRPVYMYYRGADVTPSLTLAELCATGEEDHEYVIADMLKVAYVDPDRGLAWCKDLGDKSIVKTSIHEGEQIDFMNDAQITGETGQNGRDWDQSNWILLQFTAPTGSNGIDEMLKNADRKLVKPGTIKGKLVYNDNYILKMSEDHLELLTKSDAGYDETPYVANVYCPSNFLPENLNIWGSIEAGDGAYSANNTQNYFFMNPKIQEVCYITYAQWNALGYFTVPSNSGIKGGFQVGWAYNNYNGTPSLQDGKIYKFHAIVNRTDKEYGPNNPISAKDEIPFSEHITVLPIDLTGDDNIITAINTVSVNGEVKSVKYVNVAGVMSDVPFEGVNIVVTEYTDGSRSTSKMIKR